MGNRKTQLNQIVKEIRKQRKEREAEAQEVPKAFASVGEAIAIGIGLMSGEPAVRDASFLRLYAAKLREGTAKEVDIPSVVAGVLEGIADRLAPPPTPNGESANHGE